MIKSGFRCETYQKWEIVDGGWRLQSGAFSDRCVKIGELLIYSKEQIEEKEMDLEERKVFMEKWLLWR